MIREFYKALFVMCCYRYNKAFSCNMLTDSRFSFVAAIPGIFIHYQPETIKEDNLIVSYLFKGFNAG